MTGRAKWWSSVGLTPVFLLLLLLATGITARGQSATSILQSSGKGLFTLESLALETPQQGAFEPGASPEHGNGLRPVPPGRALLFSFLVPGLGQYVQGSRKSAAAFFAAEVAFWVAAGSFHAAGQWKEDDYRLYARVHAGIDPAGKDKDFYVNIGNYNSLNDYNQAKLRARNLRDYYRDKQAYAWQWDSPENRQFYEQLRVTSDRYYNRAELMLGGVLANHLISGLHALWVSRRRENQITSRRGWNWYAQVLPYPRLRVTAHF